MSDVNLRAERDAAVARNEKANDNRIAEKMATELWLKSDKVEVGPRAISDALANHQGLGSFSTERLERLINMIQHHIRQRKARYLERQNGGAVASSMSATREQRRKERQAAQAAGERPPTIGEWLDEQLEGEILQEELEVAQLAARLFRAGGDAGVFSKVITFSGAWYSHIRPAFTRRGWKGGLTYGEILELVEVDQAESVAESVEEEELGSLTALSPDALAAAFGRSTVEDELERRGLAAPAPTDALLELDPEGETFQTQAVRRATPAEVSEDLVLKGPWGTFTLRRAPGSEDVEIHMDGRVTPETADRIAAILLAEKYSIHVSL